jgi:hypothetical protein
MLMQNLQVQLIWPPGVVGRGFAGFMTNGHFASVFMMFSFVLIWLVSHCSIGIEFNKKLHGR